MICDLREVNTDISSEKTLSARRQSTTDFSLKKMLLPSVFGKKAIDLSSIWKTQKTRDAEQDAEETLPSSVPVTSILLPSLHSVQGTDFTMGLAPSNAYFSTTVFGWLGNRGLSTRLWEKERSFAVVLGLSGGGNGVLFLHYSVVGIPPFDWISFLKPLSPSE